MTIFLTKQPNVAIKNAQSEGVFGLTSVTLPDMTVNDREENPVFSNPAVCSGHPHMLTSSIADLNNVQRELKSTPSYNSFINRLFIIFNQNSSLKI